VIVDVPANGYVRAIKVDLDVFEADGEHAAGKIGDDELKAIEDFVCPGAKYNRLLEIEQDMGAAGTYAGKRMVARAG
jgi:hypothetical protein